MKIESLLQIVLRLGLAISLIPLIIGGFTGSKTLQNGGILILLLTPLLRNIASSILYLYKKDFLFAALTIATVLLILLT